MLTRTEAADQTKLLLKYGKKRTERMCTVTDGDKKPSPITVLVKMNVLGALGQVPMNILCLHTIRLTEKSFFIKIIEQEGEFLIVGVCTRGDYRLCFLRCLPKMPSTLCLSG